jgi:hypothetical protein
MFLAFYHLPTVAVSRIVLCAAKAGRNPAGARMSNSARYFVLCRDVKLLRTRNTAPSGELLSGIEGTISHGHAIYSTGGNIECA